MKAAIFEEATFDAIFVDETKITDHDELIKANDAA